MRFVVHVITSLEAAGAQTVLRRVIEHSRGLFRSAVISLSDQGPIGQELIQQGVAVHALGMRRALAAPLVVSTLARMLKGMRPDIVQTWLYHADLLGGLAAKAAGIKRLAWSIRNSTLPASTTKWSTRAVVQICARLSNNLPDGILCCSEKAREIHVALGYDASKFVIVPNGYDLEQFSPNESFRKQVRLEHDIPEEVPLIGFMARFHPQKDHETFVRAAEIVSKRHSSVHFLLAGAGVDDGNQPLKNWLRKAGVDRATRLVGLRKDIPRLTAALDIATLCSSFGEAFPNVVGEAMACGVPCAVTDVGDAAYIVGDTGRVVRAGCPEALANAWSELIAMPTAVRRTLGRQARARIASKFEIGSVVKRYSAFYEKLEGATPSPIPAG
jgi:glycosyltransferase involved in cell wall biosynthesis